MLLRKVDFFHSLMCYDNLYPEATDPPKEGKQRLYMLAVVQAVCVSGSLHTPRFCWWSGRAWLFYTCPCWQEQQNVGFRDLSLMLRVIWLQWYLSWSLFDGGEKQVEGRIIWH